MIRPILELLTIYLIITTLGIRALVIIIIFYYLIKIIYARYI